MMCSSTVDIPPHVKEFINNNTLGLPDGYYLIPVAKDRLVAVRYGKRTLATISYQIIEDIDPRMGKYLDDFVTKVVSSTITKGVYD